jgi:hypothetical protein
MSSISKSGVDLNPLVIGNLASGYLNVTTAKDEFGGSSMRNSDFAKVSWTCQGDNTWRTLFENFQDARGTLEIWGSDSASMDRARYSFSVTTPNYGVTTWGNESYENGGWNTGAFNLQLITVGSGYNLNFQYSSYYSSTNVGTFYAHWRGVYA